MKLKQKLLTIGFVLALLTSPVLGAVLPSIGGAKASAAGTGTYEYTNSSKISVGNSSYQVGFGIVCHSSDSSPCPGTSLDILSAINNEDIYYNYTSTSSAGYVFTLDPGGCGTITISKATPGKGALKNCGESKASAISLGSSGLFNTWLNSGGPGAAPKIVTISGTIIVDYGTIDATKILSSSDITAFVKCPDDNSSDFCKTQATIGSSDNVALAGLLLPGGVSPTSAIPEVESLSKNPVKYTATIKSNLMKAGKQYIICFTGAVLKDSTGNTGATVCTKPITAKASGVASGSTRAHGAANKLSSSVAPNTDDSCEDVGGPLSWILCKLIDGLQAVIGGIYDHIIQPLLEVQPITTANRSGNDIYKAWSNFRIYGNVFLIIALLIIVFGESLGGGLIDAYTAKKVLPRLLIAAILINLSFYLVAIAVDMANIVGKGLMTLITAPFGLTGDFNISLGFTGSAGLTAALGGAVAWGAISAGTTGTFMAWLWFSVLLPLLLIFLSIMVVVLLRQALIVFLVIISPVAFALYCLPNTEKYFKKWWNLLFETLLVYPIIAALFAMGKVSGYILSNSNRGAFLNGLADMMAVIALVIPLLLVPFAFKLAGGIIGQAYALAKGGRDKMALGQASRDRLKERGRRNRVQARERTYTKLQEQASKGGAGMGGKIRRQTLGRASRITGGLLGYDVQAEASAVRAQEQKEFNDTIATGKDGEQRGLSVNKAWALKHGVENEDWRIDSDSGKRQFASAAGAWVDEADVDRAHARWGNNTFAQQASLSYEMRKAMTEKETQRIGKMYRIIAQGKDAEGNKIAGAGDGWGQNDDQAAGTWIGSAFERQNEHIEYKNSDWRTGKLKVDEKTGLAGGALTAEVYEKKGSYALSQMGSNTIEQLKEAWRSTDQVLASNPEGSDAHKAALDQRAKLQGIAETFMSRYGSGGSAAGGEDEAQDAAMRKKREEAVREALAAKNIAADSPGGRQAVQLATEGTYSTNSPGAGHVAERVREFAVLAGVYRPRDISTDIHSAGPAPTTPRQN